MKPLLYLKSEYIRDPSFLYNELLAVCLSFQDVPEHGSDIETC